MYATKSWVGLIVLALCSPVSAAIFTYNPPSPPSTGMHYANGPSYQAGQTEFKADLGITFAPTVQAPNNLLLFLEPGFQVSAATPVTITADLKSIVSATGPLDAFVSIFDETTIGSGFTVLQWLVTNGQQSNFQQVVNLQPNRVYLLALGTYAENHDGTTTNYSTGAVTMQIGNTVPEPASGVVAVIGGILSVLGYLRSKR